MSQKIIRWLAVFPVVIAVTFIVDWCTQIILFFITIPDRLFRSGTGFSNLFNKISYFLTDYPFYEALEIFITMFLTMCVLVYGLALLIPANKKITAIVLTSIINTFLFLGIIAMLVTGIFSREYLLNFIASVMGSGIGLFIMLTHYEKKTYKEYEYLMLKYLNKILVFSLLFTLLLLFILFL